MPQMDILIQINDYYNTEYALDTSWQDLFTEAPEQQQAMQLQRLRSGDLLSPRAGKTAAAAAGGWLAHDFPSEDEEDNSYTESGEVVAATGTVGCSRWAESLDISACRAAMCSAVSAVRKVLSSRSVCCNGHITCCLAPLSSSILSCYPHAALS